MKWRCWSVCLGLALLCFGSVRAQAQGDEVSVASLLEQIGVDDQDASTRAARSLAGLSPESLSDADIETLVEAIGDDNEAVQRAAVWRLLGIRDNKKKVVLERVYDRKAKVTKKTKPRYPDEARQQRIRGRVELQFVVDTAGHVENVRVLRSIPALDEAAVQCLKEWQFEPALFRQRPALFIMTESISF